MADIHCTCKVYANVVPRSLYSSDDKKSGYKIKRTQMKLLRLSNKRKLLHSTLFVCGITLEVSLIFPLCFISKPLVLPPPEASFPRFFMETSSNGYGEFFQLINLVCIPCEYFTASSTVIKVVLKLFLHSISNRCLTLFLLIWPRARTFRFLFQGRLEAYVDYDQFYLALKKGSLV